MKVGGQRLEVGGCRLEVAGWKSEVGGWRLDVGCWRLEVRSRGWRLFETFVFNLNKIEAPSSFI